MTEKYPIGTRTECEHLVREWGFRHIFTWTDGSKVIHVRVEILTLTSPSSNAHYSPHSHSGLTTHLIRRGSLTITYPDDNARLHNGEVKQETFRAGERVDVPAGKVHEVWIGNEGCEYVIGE
ncbi:hypothetical protein N7447_008925 [Penicillium robsamsonii]|uniref:uncharacterized protein n=1 Tax=Penicillium robsamsonii TaxID=1792511 RepID=UPI0025493A0F|nr:uncharacterized protein N7447_008925 [Penicillium robsamsonii]KAJ5816692.1 hypothetical protein N7447_008925 [Penicillium robsamsonii]